MWLPPALLLLCLPGCLPLTGPGSVNGTEGGSVSVQCRYEKVYRGYNKYWCRGKFEKSCKSIVQTKGKEKEERNGQVTIKDNAENLTVTVTMENLNADDAGSYWCRIQTIWIWDVLSYDPSVQVHVFVSPVVTSPVRTTQSATPSTILMETVGQNYSAEGILTRHPQFLLSSVHFLLLAFLKVPLFLSMLSAVLWVNRTQRIPERQESA
ncbi:PREDICTED: CMRF35-like molecule 2 [Chrysochloris asiatica]|uniref:CMRF35-like molecule 2 n=1 Tax=Chrysochloris asiatica TaxID=185453 RepID=A0A9B0WVR6_CHRAS|nr:PREDICTED: CMRF35-like molecule 2 [Chrysochloris asiatica]